mgnify:CR=1 FL=1
MSQGTASFPGSVFFRLGAWIFGLMRENSTHQAEFSVIYSVVPRKNRLIDLACMMLERG